MKQGFAWTLSFLLMLVLPACPIYESCPDGDCASVEPCGRGTKCGSPGPGVGSESCLSPSDCGGNQTCGADFRCHPGDCSHPTTGCVRGYECVAFAASGHVCLPESSEKPASLPYCASPRDCELGEVCADDGLCHPGVCGERACIRGFVCAKTETGAQCVRGNPASCGSEGDCGEGACIDGLCTPVEMLCSDGSQCGVGKACVDGRCIARCAEPSDCPTGFACDAVVGVCTDAVRSCANTADCGSAHSVCVGGACVPRCGNAGACAKGSVCVDNGCVPSAQRAVECDLEGTRDGCKPGQICARNHCYDDCEAPRADACDDKPVFNLCKRIETASGEYAVCGSKQNLGGVCDPSLGKRCDEGRRCIDGFCR